MKNNKILMVILLVGLITSLSSCQEIADAISGIDRDTEDKIAYEDAQDRLRFEEGTNVALTATAQASITPTLTFTPTTTPTPTITPSATPTVTPTFPPVLIVGDALLDVPVPGGDGTACNSNEPLSYPGSDIIGWQINSSDPAAPLPPGYWLNISFAAPPDQTWMTCDSCFVGVQYQAGSESPTGVINQKHEGEDTTGIIDPSDPSGQTTLPGTDGHTYVDGQGVGVYLPGNVNQFRVVTGLQPNPGDACAGDEIPWTSVDLPCIGSCP